MSYNEFLLSHILRNNEEYKALPYLELYEETRALYELFDYDSDNYYNKSIPECLQDFVDALDNP